MATPQSKAPMMAAARIWRGVGEDLTPSRIPNLNAIVVWKNRVRSRRGTYFECGGEASAFTALALLPKLTYFPGLSAQKRELRSRTQKSPGSGERGFLPN